MKATVIYFLNTYNSETCFNSKSLVWTCCITYRLTFIHCIGSYFACAQDCFYLHYTYAALKKLLGNI